MLESAHTPPQVERRTPRFEISAECFNLVRMAQRHRGPTLEFGLPGLPGNRVRVGETEWRCWNRRLDADLLSWTNFEVTKRRDLNAPVACEMTVHHPYSRTVVHRINDSLTEYLRKLLARHQPAGEAKVLLWPSKTGIQRVAAVS
jgi:hypothetical protein